MSEDYMKDFDWFFSELFPGMFDFWNRAVPINQRYREDRRQAANRLTTTGLKSIIARPHNLRVTKDENGNTVYKIDVVYTPFKKSDIQVDLESDDVLHVTIGVESTADEEFDPYTKKTDDTKLIGKWKGSWDNDNLAVNSKNDGSIDNKCNETTACTKCNHDISVNKPLDKWVYRGISKKAFSFKLYIKNLLDECCEEEIDVPNITAHAEDGILSLVLPTKKKNVEPPPTKRVSIKLS